MSFTRNELAIRLLMYVDDMAAPDSQRAWRNVDAFSTLHWCEPSHASSWLNADFFFPLSIVVASLNTPLLVLLLLAWCLRCPVRS